MPDDDLDDGYRRVAAAILLRAARDLEQGGNYAQSARRFLQSSDARVLAMGLDLDLVRFGRWVRDQSGDSRPAPITAAPRGFVPIGEACALLGISRSTGIARIENGAWAGWKVGRRWFARLSDAQAELDERQAIEVPTGWIPLREATIRAGISRPTGSYRIQSGRWRGRKIRGRWYVDAADVEAEARDLRV